MQLRSLSTDFVAANSEDVTYTLTYLKPRTVSRRVTNKAYTVSIKSAGEGSRRSAHTQKGLLIFLNHDE